MTEITQAQSNHLPMAPAPLKATKPKGETL